MANIFKPKYTSLSDLTITLTSLTNGSWRQSAAWDNTSTLYQDILIGGSIQVGTTPTANSAIEIYSYARIDNSTLYTGGASGSDGAYTADGEENLFRLLDVIYVDATSDQDYVWGPVSIAALYGGWLPSKGGILVRNGTGATLNATGTNNKIAMTGVQTELVVA